ncbi:MAG: Rpn family recombination-promoting nuclease/putative transposase [Clostridium sp.]|nr:Rpn family recombination-promoting nuclease/putative transposase [Clostridium sp.]
MSENIKKDIHHIHDKSYKDLYSKKEIAVDLFKSLVDKEWTKYLIPENLTLVNKSYITADYEELESDIVYKANLNNTEVYFYILLEFQSTVDYRMPLRLLFYMCEILREHAVNARHKKYDKNIKIPAVIPIVLYNGEEKWVVPKEFRKMIYNEELFGSNILNFTYDVFDISNDEKFNKENLVISKNVTSAIFLLDQKVDALEFLERIKVIALYFNSLSESEFKAIKNWIKNTVVKELADSAIKILEADKMEVELMVARNAFILEEMRDKAKEEGKSEGIKEGIKEVAIKLLDILDDETISEKTGLDIEKVKELRKLNS